MKLEKKHLSNFEDNGFVVIKKLLSKKDINSIFNQLNNTLSVILKFNKIKFKEKISLDDKYFLLSKKIPTLKSHFYDSIKMLDSLNSLVFSKRVLEIVKKLLNRKAVLVFAQRLRLDHKNDSHNLPLHQELNGISNNCAVIWCPLIKVSKKTGSLCLIPGSHKFGHLIYKSSNIAAEKHKIGLVDKIIKGDEKTNYGNDLVKQLFNKKNISFPKLNPGDAVIFRTFLFHGSTPYVGKGIRWTFVSHFHPLDKTPYILDKNSKYMNIPYEADYNKII